MTYKSEQDADTPAWRLRFEETARPFVDDLLSSGHFDQAAGTVTANSGSALDAARYATFANGQCYNFDGLSNYSGLSGLGTVEAVVNFTSVPATARMALVMHAASTGFKVPLALGFNLDGSNSGKLQVGYYTGSVWQTTTYSTGLSTGRWYDLAGTYDGTNLTLYVDGAQVATSVPGTPRPAPGSGTVSQYVVVGNAITGSTYLSAKLADIALYGTALTSTRVGVHNTALRSPVVAGSDGLRGQVIVPARVAGSDGFRGQVITMPTVVGSDGFQGAAETGDMGWPAPDAPALPSFTAGIDSEVEYT